MATRDAFDRDSQCEGKRRFPSFRTADKIAKRMRRRRDAAYVAAYPCPFCRHFHIGGQR